MNFMSITNVLGPMADGAIPGDKHMNSAEIWGVTLAGFGIVFAALVILVFVIFLFGRIFEAMHQKKKNKESAQAATQAPKSAPAVKAVPVPKATPPAASSDEDEVVAAIMAAIAMMSAADGKTYKIRSIKPAAGRLEGRAAWAMDGRRQNVMPF